MAISTKTVKKPGVPKDIRPGNVECKINKIELTKAQTQKDPKKPEYILTLELETRPIGGDFEGFPVDKDKPEKGLYKGQVKQVKMTDFPIREFEYTRKKDQQKVVVTLEEQICNHLAKITAAMKSDWLEKADGKFNTIKELVEGFNRAKPFKGIFLDFCIAATVKKVDGYNRYYCFLPDFKVCEMPIAAIGDDKMPVTPFSKELHLKYAENAAPSDTSDDEEEEEVEEETYETEDEEPMFETEEDGPEFETEDDEPAFEEEED